MSKDDWYYKNYYIRDSNEIEILENCKSNWPSHQYSMDSSTSSNSSSSSSSNQNSNKTDKNFTNEINMINTGVVKSLRKIFNQNLPLSTSPITTSTKHHKSNISEINKRNFMKTSYDNFFELKKCKSVLLDERMDETNNFKKLEKAKSNNYLNEIVNNFKKDEELFENVDIKARISQFTRRNSLVKESKNLSTKKKYFNSKSLKYNKIELNEYKGSLNYLDKIDDVSELNQSNQNNSLDDSDTTMLSDDFISLDNSSTNSNKDSQSSCTNLSSIHSSPTNDKKEQIVYQSIGMNQIKLDKNFEKIVFVLDELKEDNLCIQKMLLEVKSKIEEASIAFQKNLDEFVNNSLSSIEDETNKENCIIDITNLDRFSNLQSNSQIKLIRQKF